MHAQICCINLLTPKRTQVSPFTEISILFLEGLAPSVTGCLVYHLQHFLTVAVKESTKMVSVSKCTSLLAEDLRNILSITVSFSFRLPTHSLIGNILVIPSKNRIGISVKGDTFVLLGAKRLMQQICACMTFQCIKSMHA